MPISTIISNPAGFARISAALYAIHSIRKCKLNHSNWIKCRRQWTRRVGKSNLWSTHLLYTRIAHIAHIVTHITQFQIDKFLMRNVFLLSVSHGCCLHPFKHIRWMSIESGVFPVFLLTSNPLSIHLTYFDGYVGFSLWLFLHLPMYVWDAQIKAKEVKVQERIKYQWIW